MSLLTGKGVPRELIHTLIQRCKLALAKANIQPATHDIPGPTFRRSSCYTINIGVQDKDGVLSFAQGFDLKRKSVAAVRAAGIPCSDNGTIIVNSRGEPQAPLEVRDALAPATKPIRPPPPPGGTRIMPSRAMFRARRALFERNVHGLRLDRPAREPFLFVFVDGEPKPELLAKAIEVLRDAGLPFDDAGKLDLRSVPRVWRRRKPEQVEE